MKPQMRISLNGRVCKRSSQTSPMEKKLLTNSRISLTHLIYHKDKTSFDWDQIFTSHWGVQSFQIFTRSNKSCILYVILTWTSKQHQLEGRASCTFSRDARHVLSSFWGLLKLSRLTSTIVGSLAMTMMTPRKPPGKRAFTFHLWISQLTGSV